MAYNVPLSSIRASDGNVTYAQGSVIRVGAGGNVNAVGSVVINSTGNVGISTANPQYKLDVSGDINFTGTLNQNSSPFVASRWTSGTGDDIYRLNGDVGIGTTSPGQLLDVADSSTITSYNDFVQFRQTNGSGTFTRILFGQVSTKKMFMEVADQSNSKGDMLIQPYGGNVSIGTATVSYASNNRTTLTLNGASDSLMAFAAAGSAKGYVRTDGTSMVMQAETGELYLYTGAGGGVVLLGTKGIERVRIDESGDVGIGTSTPQGNLHVMGNLWLSNNAAFIGGVRFPDGTFQTTAAQSTPIPTGVTSASNITVTSTATNATFYPAFIEATTGNLGIRADSGFSYNPGADQLTAGAFIPTSSTVPANGMYLIAANTLGFATGSAEEMRLDSFGNLSIGTSTVGYGFANRTSVTINGTSESLVAMLTGGTARGYLQGTASQIVLASTNTLTLVSGTSNGMLFWTSGSERMRIDSVGNVGIGTTSTASRLTVNGIIHGQSVAGAGDVLIIGNDSKLVDINVAHIGGIQSTSTPAIGGLQFGSGGGTIFGANSNIGIATTSPAYTLEVNGSFAAITKSFVIDHPTKPGHKLRYGSLEGPENGVYFRGSSDKTIIDLPDYWSKLVDPESITVSLTAYGVANPELHVVEIKDNKISVHNNNLKYFFIVYAERRDVEKLQVEVEPDV